MYKDETKDKLVELHNQNHQIVIFTNQGGVAIGRVKVNDLKHKFAEIQKTVGIPMIFMACTANTKHDSPYRKPSTGMFERVCKLLGSVTDISKSFYCGDAAGRQNDHTNDDLLFSINNKLRFFTPEMLFKNEELNFNPLPGTILGKSESKC